MITAPPDWIALCDALRVTPEVARRVGEELAARYGEAHRAYHDLAHVRYVLAEIDRLVASGAPVAELPAVRLAAWFHDVVYRPGKTDNEDASAGLAQERLADMGVAHARRERVATLIMATAQHTPDDHDAMVLCDADLAILASEPADYRAYVTAIRREYGWLDEAAWRDGRGAFVDAMLGRHRVFHTAPMARAEAVARRNLSSERSALGRG